jgi:hypothetical protein
MTFPGLLWTVWHAPLLCAFAKSLKICGRGHRGRSKLTLHRLAALSARVLARKYAMRGTLPNYAKLRLVAKSILIYADIRRVNDAGFY